jgi:hypothetical protein
MFRCRVLLGEHCKGFVYQSNNLNLNQEQRPRKPNGEYFHSSSDLYCQNFCIYDEDQCYPEYLITYEE